MSSKSTPGTPMSIDEKDDKEMVIIELTKSFHIKRDMQLDSPDNDFQPIKIASSTENDSIIKIPLASISRIFITNNREGLLKSSSMSGFNIPTNKPKKENIIYSKSSAFTKKGGRKLKKNKSKRKTSKHK